MKLGQNEIIEVLLAIIEHQAEKIFELKARLNQNSKNSSMPPSSDLSTKLKSLHKPSGKKYSSKDDEIVANTQIQNSPPEKTQRKKERPKPGKVEALIDRLVLRKVQWLLFFADFSALSNNQAERDFRMFKVKQKVSGCFRTIEGAKDFATVMSLVSTARKNGSAAFLAIKDAFLNQLFSVRLALATG